MDNPLNDLKTRGHRLRTLRLAVGISEEDAAKVFKVGVKTYQRYEAGKSKPRSMQGEIDFSHLCEEKSLDWLFFAECYKSISRPNTKIAIAGIYGPRYRHADLALRIFQLLPRDRNNAKAVLGEVQKLMQIYHPKFVESGNVVAFPRSS